MVSASPCIQAEQRKNILDNRPETVFSRIRNAHPEGYGSPESIASAANSFNFVDEPRFRAKRTKGTYSLSLRLGYSARDRGARRTKIPLQLNSRVV